MHEDRDDEPLSFVERRLPEGFAARTFTIAAGCERGYEQREWADSIIVVEEGVIELECLGGTRSRFAAGAVLCFDSLPLRTLRNTGREPALLSAVSRRAQPNGLVRLLAFSACATRRLTSAPDERQLDQ